MTHDEKADALRKMGFTVGPRDPNFNRAFKDKFMVIEVRKPTSAAATMQRPVATANAKPDHETIVKLALRIASAIDQGNHRRYVASRLSKPSPMAEQFERAASSLDDDVCQLCVEMQRACNGEPGPFPSDSWSHLDDK